MYSRVKRGKEIMQTITTELTAAALEVVFTPFGSLYGDGGSSSERKALAEAVMGYMGTPRGEPAKTAFAGQIVDLVLAAMGQVQKKDDPPDYNTYPAQVLFGGTWEVGFVTPTSKTSITAAYDKLTVDFGPNGSEHRAKVIMAALKEADVRILETT